MSTPAAFYFDLASPQAYLAAERILQVFSSAADTPLPMEWRPVLAKKLKAHSALARAEQYDGARSAKSEPLRGAAAEDTAADAWRGEVERRAHELGLQPLRWPEPFPFDSSLAMRVATYAASIGRAIPFAQAAFRQAFAGGHSLEDPDYVLIAAAACEMHPRAVLQGAELDAVAQRLAGATAAARAAGVLDVPAVVVGGKVFVGERELERAAACMHDERLDAGGAPRAIDAAADAATGATGDHAGATRR